MNNRQNAIQNQTFGNIRRNIEVETKLNKMALKKSSNADVKNFAHQVITDDHKLQDRVNMPVSADSMAVAPQVPKQTQDAEKQIKKLSGTKFDQKYLVQMIFLYPSGSGLSEYVVAIERVAFCCGDRRGMV